MAEEITMGTRMGVAEADAEARSENVEVSSCRVLPNTGGKRIQICKNNIARQKEVVGFVVTMFATLRHNESRGVSGRFCR